MIQRHWIIFLAVLLCSATGVASDDPELSSGVRVGATFRDFDYDDVNDLLDYDGTHITLRAGFAF